MTWDDGGDSTNRTKVRRSTTVPLLPLVLIAIGLSVIFDRIVGGGFSAWEVFWLAVGIWCLARARDDGPYPLLVIGAFLVGNNIGQLVGTLISRDMADATETLGTAAAFLWLYVYDRPRSRWAIFVAAIAGFIGMAELGAEVTELAGEGGGWLLPAGVIVAGVLLLGAHRMPGPLRLAGLVFVAAAALSLLANGNDDDNNGRRGIGTRQPPTTQGAEPFDLGSRRLEIETENGAVVVQQGDTPEIVSGRVTTVDEDEIHVVPRTDNGPVVVRVPPGTPLDISVENGSVAVTVPTANADITSENGTITMMLLGDPSIDAESDNGTVVVDGKSEGGAYADSGTSGNVEVTSENGQIILTHAPASATPTTAAGLR